MQIIVIENTVYKITESLYSELMLKYKEISDKEYYHSQQMEISDYIDSILPKLTLVGSIAFDYRL